MNPIHTALDLSAIFQSDPVVDSLPSGMLSRTTSALDCLRLDKVHPFISGNKWYKLKHHFNDALKADKRCILSFGGAYSNHLHALAYAGHCIGIETIGVVRGEAPETLTPTLQDCERWGMQIEWMSRRDYRSYATMAAERSLQDRFPQAWIVPEGGEGRQGVQGVRELFQALFDAASEPYDYVVCPVGSGTTLAGIVAGSPGQTHCIGFSVLKNALDLEHRVDRMLDSVEGSHGQWHICHDYHFGGFAKRNARLSDFISAVHADYGLLLDPVYTGKALFGLLEWSKQGRLRQDARILLVHTGGLQGWRGFGDRWPVIGDDEQSF